MRVLINVATLMPGQTNLFHPASWLVIRSIYNWVWFFMIPMFCTGLLSSQRREIYSVAEFILNFDHSFVKALWPWWLTWSEEVWHSSNMEWADRILGTITRELRCPQHTKRVALQLNGQWSSTPLQNTWHAKHRWWCSATVTGLLCLIRSVFSVEREVKAEKQSSQSELAGIGRSSEGASLGRWHAACRCI